MRWSDAAIHPCQIQTKRCMLPLAFAVATSPPLAPAAEVGRGEITEVVPWAGLCCSLLRTPGPTAAVLPATSSGLDRLPPDLSLAGPTPPKPTEAQEPHHRPASPPWSMWAEATGPGGYVTEWRSAPQGASGGYVSGMTLVALFTRPEHSLSMGQVAWPTPGPTHWPGVTSLVVVWPQHDNSSLNG